MGLLSSLFGQKSNGEEALKRAISVAYSRNEEAVHTRIPWWEAEKFAQDRGVKVAYKGDLIYATIHMLVNNEEVVALFTKNQDNGNTHVTVFNQKTNDEEVISEIISITQMFENEDEAVSTMSNISLYEFKEYFTSQKDKLGFLPYIGNDFLELTNYNGSLKVRIDDNNGEGTKWSLVTES